MAWKVWAIVGGCLLTSSQIRKSELGGEATHVVPPSLSTSRSVFNPGLSPLDGPRWVPPLSQSSLETHPKTYTPRDTPH